MTDVNRQRRSWLALVAMLACLWPGRPVAAEPATLPAPPAIVNSDDRPWEDLGNGSRRKVWYTDHLTVVLFETRGPSAALFTHSHPQDQITYVLEGRALAQVGDETREVGPGSVYVAPGGVVHGIKILSQRFVGIDTFSPARPDFLIGENDVKAFVYQWFSWLDRRADVGVFLPHLADQGLSMTFPDVRVQSPEAFRKWYGNVLQNVESSHHDVADVQASRLPDGDFQVHLTVTWVAHLKDGHDSRQTFHQTWTLAPDMTGVIRIKQYDVTTP